MKNESFINGIVLYENNLQINYSGVDRTTNKVDGEIWLTYETQTSFSHSIHDNHDLVDKGCTIVHPHDTVPIKVKVHEKPNDGQFIDFKTIKSVVEGILEDGAGFKGHIGLIDSEHYISELRKMIAIHLKIPLGEVRVSMKETTKYGVEIE